MVGRGCCRARAQAAGQLWGDLEMYIRRTELHTVRKNIHNDNVYGTMKKIYRHDEMQRERVR